MNYRHQADACHAYHIVRRGGIPAENVILFMYDDAASSLLNPVPGTLFNKPTPEGTPGWNVYEGCEITYQNEAATKENFLAVLTGRSDLAGGLPVLQSGPDDKVFITFFDHGAPGLVAMPVGEPVYANELMDALKLMATRGMYSELVFYLEACESGSMFEGLLPDDMKIFVTTAANAQESSWGTYCGSDATVNGVSINSCLGDLYSVNWMEDSDLPGHYHTESLEAQYEYVKSSTDKSHVMQFGDTGFGDERIDSFQGLQGFPSVYDERAAALALLDVPKVGVNSRDIPLYTLEHMRDVARTPEERVLAERALAAEISHRKSADAAFAAILEQIPATNVKLSESYHGGALTALDCLKPAHEAVQKFCGRYTDYSMGHGRVISNLCEEGVSADEIARAAESVCTGAGLPQFSDGLVELSEA
jgi:legumain